MPTGREWLVVIGVVLVYGAIRMLPRFMAGFSSYLSPAQVKQALDDKGRLMILDVRTPTEFAAEPGHIPGAINVPMPELSARLERDSALQGYRDALVIAVCRTDARAAFAVRVLKRHGFERAYVMSGGISAWTADGLPITQPPTSEKRSMHS